MWRRYESLSPNTTSASGDPSTRKPDKKDGGTSTDRPWSGTRGGAVATASAGAVCGASTIVVMGETQSDEKGTENAAMWLGRYSPIWIRRSPLRG